MFTARSFSLTLIALAAGTASAFTTIGTKWGMGPNVSTLLSGHEGTPGMATWSVMPSGLKILAESDTHEGSVTSSFGALIGDPFSDAEEKAMISSVYSMWSSVCGLTVTGAMDGGAPGGAPEADGAHLGDMRYGSIAPFPSGVLGHAFGPGTEALFGPGATIRGDVHMNSALTWVDDPMDPDDGGAYDLFTVMLHEAGHSLGLGHSDAPGSIMAAEYVGGHRFLSPDDIAGIKHIYGPVVPEPTSMIVLALGAVLLRRKKQA